MKDIVERLEGSLQVVPTHMLRLGDIAEAGSCIKHQRAEIERLNAVFKRECDLTVDLRAICERLRAALVAQNEADEANESRAGYDNWQALEDRAKELRMAALGDQQSSSPRDSEKT